MYLTKLRDVNTGFESIFVSSASGKFRHHNDFRKCGQENVELGQGNNIGNAPSFKLLGRAFMGQNLPSSSIPSHKLTATDWLGSPSNFCVLALLPSAQTYQDGTSTCSPRWAFKTSLNVY